MKTPIQLIENAWRTFVSARRHPSSVVPPPVCLQALEDRILYDASPLAVVVADVNEPIEPNGDLDYLIDAITETADYDSPYETSPLLDQLPFDDYLLGQPNDDLAFEEARQLIVIDERIDGIQQLVDDVLANGATGIGFDVVRLAEFENGIERISEALNGQHKYDAVHIIGHGTDANIQLGRNNLNSETVAVFESQLSGWTSGLAFGADILLYGCDVAATEDGQLFVDRIGEFTGADVAASEDLTGHASLGGDWTLEYRFGSVDTEIAFSIDVQQSWMGVLDSVTVTATQDTYIKANEPTNNFGDSSSLIVDRESGDLQCALFQFDVSSIDSGTNIQSATLKLYSTSIDGELNIGVYELLEDWSEGTGNGTFDTASWNQRNDGVGWTTAGAYFDPTALDLLTTSTSGLHTWDVTSLVSDWVSGSKVNNGVLIASPDGGGSRTVTYDSREGSVVPVLEIHYGGNENEGIAVWRENGTTTPETSFFNGITFGAESNTANVDQWEVIQGADSNTRDETILIGIDSGKTMRGQIWDGSTWTPFSINDLGYAKNEKSWSFDVAYESQSDDAVMVWGDTTSLKYSIWDGTSWASPTTISAYDGAEIRHMQLEANPNSDEMVLALTDNNGDDYAPVWNGSSWSNRVLLNTINSQNVTDISVAYEQQSGDAIVVYAKDQTDVHYRTWNGSTWSAESTLTAPSGPSGKARWTMMDSDPNSDRIVLGVLTEAEDAYFAVWDGSSWSTSDKLSATTDTNDRGYPNIAVAFESNSGEALVTYGEEDNFVRYRTWNDVTGWSNEQSGPNVGDKPTSMTLDRDPASDRVVLSTLDENKHVSFVLWDGSGWGTPDQQEANSGQNDAQPFIFLWNQKLNEAPILDATQTPVLTFINEDAGSPSGAVGTLVSSLVDFASPNGGVDNVTDPDNGALLGIAITDSNTANGTWYFSTDNGTNWNALGSVSDASAHLLAADAATRLYFQPSANFNGTIGSAITFRAWDQTDGRSNGTTGVDTTNNGGSTAYSADTDTASLTVNAINDAPSGVSASLFPSISEDEFNSSGKLVSDFTSSTTDVDAGAVKGIAVIGANGTNGTWQYTLDGTDWLNVGSVSESSARLLPSDPDTRVRFVPNPDYNGTVFPFTYVAWDQTTGTAGGLADASVRGGTTAFSSNSASVSQSVSAVNDAPVATIIPSALGVSEDDGYRILAGFSISDVDHGGSDVSMTLSVSDGVVNLGDTTGLTLVGGEQQFDDELHGHHRRIKRGAGHADLSTRRKFLRDRHGHFDCQ